MKKDKDFEKLIDIQKTNHFCMSVALKFWDNFDMELYKRILKAKNNE